MAQISLFLLLISWVSVNSNYQLLASDFFLTHCVFDIWDFWVFVEKKSLLISKPSTKAFCWVSLQINPPTTTNVFIWTRRKKLLHSSPRLKLSLAAGWASGFTMTVSPLRWQEMLLDLWLAAHWSDIREAKQWWMLSQERRHDIVDISKMIVSFATTSVIGNLEMWMGKNAVISCGLCAVFKFLTFPTNKFKHKTFSL